MHKHPILTCALTTLISTTALADNIPPQFGVALAAPVVTQEPDNLHAVQGLFWYQPKQFVWEHARVLFDAAVGHWWVTTHDTPYKSTNIIAVSPVFRYYIFNSSNVNPFIMLSIGLSYLSKTRLGEKNLGIHFSFQDRAGVGLTFGKEQKFSVMASALHYSNGGLSSSNSGITAPLMLTAEYGFG